MRARPRRSLSPRAAASPPRARPDPRASDCPGLTLGRMPSGGEVQGRPSRTVPCGECHFLSGVSLGTVKVVPLDVGSEGAQSPQGESFRPGSYFSPLPARGAWTPSNSSSPLPSLLCSPPPPHGNTRQCTEERDKGGWGEAGATESPGGGQDGNWTREHGLYYCWPPSQSAKGEGLIEGSPESPKLRHQVI